MQVLEGTIRDKDSFVVDGNTVHTFTLVKAGTEYPVEDREVYRCTFVVQGIKNGTVGPLALKISRLREGVPVTVGVEYDANVSVVTENEIGPDNEPLVNLRIPVTVINSRTPEPRTTI